MNARMNGVTQFYFKHEAWIAVVVLCIAMYSAGWISGTIMAQTTYRVADARMDKSYNDTIAAKDKLIALLATSTATASNQAASATDNAATAATLATQAAGAAASAASAADKATDNKKALGKLK